MTQYKVGIVGESNYQPAIARCRIGEAVLVRHQPTNRHDPLALVVTDGRGDVIGYIARDSWLRDAIHDEDNACAASIARISDGGVGLLGVVLDVALTDGPIDAIQYLPAARRSPPPPASSPPQVPQSRPARAPVKRTRSLLQRLFGG